MTQSQAEPFVSKSQWAYRTVRAMILSGELEPGTSLDQQALAAQLGISTTPLREALRALEAEDYVISRDHREMLIAPMSLEFVEQIYQVRLELDPLAARLACANMTDAQIDALERLIPAASARSKVGGPHSNSRDFHRNIYVASGNVALIRVMESLYDQFERYRVQLRDDPALARQSRQDHVRMCALLKKRDADGLAKLMQEHLLASLEHCRRDIPEAGARPREAEEVQGQGLVTPLVEPGDLVERLRRLDTSAVSDALDSLGLAGVVTGISPLWAAGRIAGRVVPVQLVPLGEAPPPPHHLGTAAIEAGGPDDVIVVDNRGRVEMGGWGGLLARAAQARGIAGVVVDGACRDADEMAEIGFPVFARACTARTARGRVVERVTEEIVIGGVAVHGGDFVLADRTAIVFVASADAVRVITAAEAIVAREAAMTTALAQGLPATSVMGLAYEELLTRVALGGGEGTHD